MFRIVYMNTFTCAHLSSSVNLELLKDKMHTFTVSYNFSKYHSFIWWKILTQDPIAQIYQKMLTRT